MMNGLEGQTELLNKMLSDAKEMKDQNKQVLDEAMKMLDGNGVIKDKNTIAFLRDSLNKANSKDLDMKSFLENLNNLKDAS